MIEFDRFIDRSRPGRTITQGGFTSHAQAGARLEAEGVVFLLLQGRQLDVRAHGARFLEGKLPHYHPLPGKDVYLTHNNILPGGVVEIAFVHRALVPSRLPEGATHLFTFGPPHFGRMFRVAAPLPVPPHGESVLWELGQEAGLILELRDTWNVCLWMVRLDAERWRQAVANGTRVLPNENGALSDGDPEP